MVYPCGSVLVSIRVDIYAVRRRCDDVEEAYVLAMARSAETCGAQRPVGAFLGELPRAVHAHAYPPLHFPPHLGRELRVDVNGAYLREQVRLCATWIKESDGVPT
jgi:hypothetical protein